MKKKKQTFCIFKLLATLELSVTMRGNEK